MIQLERLTFGYGHGTPVFQDFTWTAARGEAWAVLGPSGCGKSTLLNILAGLVQPASGFVRIDGQNLTRPRPQTGLIIQDYGLLPWATVRENARLGLRVRNYYGPDGIHAPDGYVRGWTSSPGWNAWDCCRKPRSFPVSFPAVNASAPPSRGP